MAKSVAKMRPSGPPMIPPALPPVAAQVPRILSHHLAFLLRCTEIVFSHIRLCGYAISGSSGAPGSMVFPPFVASPTQMVPKPAPTMARWKLREHRFPQAPKPVPTGAPKAAPIEAPAVVPTTAPPPSPTTVPLSSLKAGPPPVTTTVPRPSTSMTPAAPHEAPNEMQLMALELFRCVFGRHLDRRLCQRRPHLCHGRTYLCQRRAHLCRQPRLRWLRRCYLQRR